MADLTSMGSAAISAVASRTSRPSPLDSGGPGAQLGLNGLGGILDALPLNGGVHVPPVPVLGARFLHRLGHLPHRAHHAAGSNTHT